MIKYTFELPDDFDISKCFFKHDGHKMTVDMPMDHGSYHRYETYISPETIEETKRDDNGEGLLVLQCPWNIKPSEYGDAYTLFFQQKAMGVVLLPPGYKALYIPKDVSRLRWRKQTNDWP